ncbi:hypothetical protein FBU59_000241 [Linderina macrospora]|uniref:Uncharacterized protein n=1 Tax=Linderina macrospora TaxID=4868 RepID=A0ACC1JHF9_9FUNG|nr:hypothetical protein FBU59_000241 [Linderina macrospora]
MNLFGSFTNDTSGGSATGNSLADLTIDQLPGTTTDFDNDLSGFGVDLSALELTSTSTATGGIAGMDLSAIQLLQLDDTGTGATGQPAAAGDPSQLMAQLLGGTTQASVAGGVQQQGLGLAIGQPEAPAVAARQQQQQQATKSRASSQSSEDMDIPLAQLAMRQSRPAAPAASSAAAQMASSPGAALGIGLAAPIAPQITNMPAAAIPASSPSIAASVPGSTPFIERGTTGVESTVLLSKTDKNAPVNANLKLELQSPDTAAIEAPLDELEEIEAKLCSLLGTAATAIRMLAEPKEVGEFGDDLLNSGNTARIEPSVDSFMRTVAEVHAGLRHQHARLVERGISIKPTAVFASDTAGAEADLMVWTDAARVLAGALDSALALQASGSQ